MYKPSLTDEEWKQMTPLLFVSPVLKTKTVSYVSPNGPSLACPMRVELAWALLRHFRTGEDWVNEKTKRKWAEEEYAAFVEREREKLPKPKLVE